MGTVTTGYHRVSNITARAPYSTTQEVVPGATITVTLTSSGAGAVIYSDPGMTIIIPGALITADPSGAYDYYVPLDYMVTETITSVSGLDFTIDNIGQNTGPLGAQTPVIGEVVAGIGTAFVLAHTPLSGSVALYHLTARLWVTTDYTISGADITMTYSIGTGELLADYRY